MASFAIIRGTAAEIETTPIVDGQLLFETDQVDDNKIYGDVGSTRITLGNGGGGISFLKDLRDTQIVAPAEKQILQLIDESGTLKWENKDALDDWLSDNNGIIYKTLNYGTISISFTQAELAPVINGGYSVKPYIECVDGVAPPTLIDMIYNTNDSSNYLVVKYSTISSAQAGGTSGTACRLKLRIIK